jgi:hypothetical protein
MLCSVGDMYSKRHSSSRKNNFHHHHHHNHHHHKHQHHYFNHRVQEENKDDIIVGSRVISSEQIHKFSIQNFMNSHIDDGERLRYYGTTEEPHQVLQSLNRVLGAKSSVDSSTNQEPNELSDVVSNGHVGSSRESSRTSNMLAQKYDNIEPSFTSRNTPLRNIENNFEIWNDIHQPYHRMSARQKSKRFFPDVNKDISMSDGVAVASSLSANGDSTSNLERRLFDGDILQDNFIRKDLCSHKKYQDYDRKFDVHKIKHSLKTHHKHTENIDQNTINNDTWKQIQLLESKENDIFNDSRYQNGVNTIQFRHSYHLRQMDGRSFRSLIEPIETSEVETVGVHWPVKREAVVEGDLVLGGLMMVHEREDMYTCGPIMPQGGIQALETMLYTLDVLNRDQMIPNVTIGAHILDDCDKDTYGLEMAVDFIKGRRRWT